MKPRTRLRITMYFIILAVQLHFESMRIFRFLLFWCLLGCCPNLSAEVIISGVLKNYGNSSIRLGTVANYELASKWDTIQLDAKDYAFQIQLDIKDIALVNIDLSPKTGSNKMGWQRLKIVASPGDSIHFEMNFESSDQQNGMPTCKFFGVNAKGHEEFYQYQYFPVAHHADEFTEGFKKEDGVEANYRRFLTSLGKFIDPYEKLLAQGEIDSMYYHFASEFTITGIVSTIVTSLYRRDLADIIEDKQAKLELAGKLLDLCPKIGKATLLADMNFTFLTHCELYKYLVSKGVSDFQVYPDTLIRYGGRTYKVTEPFSGIFHLDEDSLGEFYFAHYLMFFYETMLGLTEYYDEPFSYFKARFSGSIYTKALEEARRRNIEMNEASDNTTPIEVNSNRYYKKWDQFIIDDAGEMKDFSFENDVIDLKKKAYYIDIWASWCQPCLAEMKHNYKVDSLLDQHGIERIYISIDNFANFNQWLSTIDRFHLVGGHVLAGEALKEMLASEVIKDSRLPIPRYLFIKHGKVVVDEAARPSNLQALQEQIVFISKL